MADIEYSTSAADWLRAAEPDVQEQATTAADIGSSAETT